MQLTGKVFTLFFCGVLVWFHTEKVAGVLNSVLALFP
jgi:hypothetical protein